MTPTGEDDRQRSRAVRTARTAAAALLVDLVRLEGGLERLEPEELVAHPEARSLVQMICEAYGALTVRIEELHAAIRPLRNVLSAASVSQQPFIVHLSGLDAPSYLELLVEAARRHRALLHQNAANAGVASCVASRSVSLRETFEPPLAPVPYLTLGACVEQELRSMERMAHTESDRSISSKRAAPPPDNAGAVSIPSSPSPGGTQEDVRGLLSCADLAAAFGVDQERLRGRLKRWQRTCFNGWVEVTDRGPRDPQYLYQVSVVMPILRALQQRLKENK